MSEGKVSVEIENVVASASLEHGVDLNDVAKAFPKVKYRPEQFPGLVFRLNKPRTATLIFNSGKMVCTGAKSAGEARKAVRKVVKKLKKRGIIIMGEPETKVVNIVASAKLGGKVDLVKWYKSQSIGGRIMYEPEQFPGLIYRMKNPKAVILLFSSGKLVCTGATHEEHVYQAVNRIKQKLEEDGCIFYSDLGYDAG